MKEEMATNQRTIERLARALREPRYEVIPLRGTEEQVLEHVPKEAKLTVTASPEKGMEDTLQLASNWFIRVLLPGGYSPDDLVEEVGPYLSDPGSGVYGFHIYTFNEVEKTEAWRQEMLKRIEAGG
jgi:hypothetical protein